MPYQVLYVIQKKGNNRAVIGESEMLEPRVQQVQVHLMPSQIYACTVGAGHGCELIENKHATYIKITWHNCF